MIEQKLKIAANKLPAPQSIFEDVIQRAAQDTKRPYLRKRISDWIMRKLRFLCVISLLLLCGCSNEVEYENISFDGVPALPIEEVTDIPAFELNYNGAIVAASNFYADENGLIVLHPETNILYYEDYNSGECYPLCAKTNCTHDTENCGGYITGSNLYYDGTWVYYLSGMDISCWRQRTDGSDRERVFSLNANEQKLGAIHTPIYHNGKVYFSSIMTELEQETGEWVSRERIIIGDLSTGEIKPVPIEFGGNRGGSTLNLLGLYDSTLVVKQDVVVSSTMSNEVYHSTFFTIDLNNWELMILLQQDWNSSDEDDVTISYKPQAIPQGLMIINILDTDSRIHISDSFGETVAIWHGDRLLIDLDAMQGYVFNNSDNLNATDENVADGNFIYYRWNEAHSAVIKTVRNLTTGEEFQYADLKRLSLMRNQSADSDYFLIYMYGEEGARFSRIKKSDFWYGTDSFIRLSDWIILAG